MGYKELINHLKSTITDKSTDEEVEKTLNMVKDVEKLEQEHIDLVDKSESYRKKYIDSCLNRGTNDVVSEPTKSSKPKTLEEIAMEIINGGK